MSRVTAASRRWSLRTLNTDRASYPEFPDSSKPISARVAPPPYHRYPFCSDAVERAFPLVPRRSLPRGENDLVFPSRLGVPYTASGLRAILRRAAPGVTPYQLRHTFAQHAIDSGVATDDLAGLLGHSDVRTTRHYAKIRADRLRRVASGLTSPLPAGPLGNQSASTSQASDPSAAPAPRGKSGTGRRRRSAG